MRIHEARLARQADRQRASEEQQAREDEAEHLRVIEEQELALAQVLRAEVEAEAAELARKDRLTAKALSMADQKVLRDARYAARKSRQSR